LTLFSWQQLQLVRNLTNTVILVPEHSNIKKYWSVKIQLHIFLTIALIIAGTDSVAK